MEKDANGDKRTQASSQLQRQNNEIMFLNVATNSLRISPGTRRSVQTVSHVFSKRILFARY